MDAELLNSQFGIPNQLNFSVDESGLVFANINTAQAEAKICLQGAHLLYWRPRSGSVPVVWLSEGAKYVVGKSAHSGAPVCWPWFGNHASQPSYPQHGFARTALWHVTATQLEQDATLSLEFTISYGEAQRALWPHSCVAKLKFNIGDKLHMSLETANTGDTAFTLGEALHTYFQISDIEKIKLSGLDQTEYLDKVQDFARFKQEGDIAFHAETDRVYLDTESTCIIEDAGLKRRIVIAKTGSRSTVVWTPWTEKALAMGDLGPNEGWRKMVCVESANTASNVVTVQPGELHTMAVHYRVETW